MAWDFAGAPGDFYMRISKVWWWQREEQSKSTLRSCTNRVTQWPDCAGFATQGRHARKENMVCLFLQFLEISYGCFSSSFSLQRHGAFVNSALGVVQLREEKNQPKEITWALPLDWRLWHKNLSLEGPQGSSFPGEECEYMALWYLGMFREWLRVSHLHPIISVWHKNTSDMSQPISPRS